MPDTPRRSPAAQDFHHACDAHLYKEYGIRAEDLLSTQRIAFTAMKDLGHVICSPQMVCLQFVTTRGAYI